MSERTTVPFRVHRPGWVDEFRAFIMRGNVIDLAVGIVIGVRAGHPLTKVDSIHDLKDYTWLAWDPFDIPGGMFSEIYKRLNLELPKKIIRCSSTVLYTQLAAETDCVCMLTTPALEWVGFKQRLKVLSLKESLPTMQIGLVYRNESLITQIATEFHGFVKSICKEK